MYSSLSNICLPYSYPRKGPPDQSSWSNAILCLTENWRWYRRAHRLYLLNYFLLGCHPLGERDVLWSIWSKLGFWPFHMWLLGRIAGYWVIINGVHGLGVGNAMWYVVGGWIGIPGGWYASYGIHGRNWVVILVVGVAPISGYLLCGACICGTCIHSHGHVWGGTGFSSFWRISKFFLGFY